MSKLIIDGNAVYEIDENCLKQKQLKQKSQAVKNNKTSSVKIESKKS